ncbi:SAV_2336 N-terminal domain-related protein [Streptomyces sp. BR1]|uniref:SAV_2336 N-terminal domain-related protein n=1 Tax=Streptomyces sp. BR1 TaxID=1592323 RepID=UPI00402BB72A
MTSDGPFGHTDALRRVLGAAGTRAPTGQEIAELLWLARHMRDEPEFRTGGNRLPPPSLPEDTPRPDIPEGDEPPPAPAERPDAPERVPLRTPPPNRPTPAPERDGEHAPLLAPAPAMLAHPLALQRAVRPLKRRVPSAREREFDETATAHRGALFGARPEWWLPVLRPRPERWLHLRIVFDTGPTMTMWRPLLRDLHRALAQTGAFRTVERLPLATDGGVPVRPAATSRTAVLVLSDCMGPQWRDGPAGRRWYRTVHGWARTLPVAVVQPLPERLWQYSAFAPTAGLLSAPGPGAAGALLTFLPYDTDAAPAVPGAIPVPVLEPAARWLGNWAELVGARGGAQVPGAVALLGPRPPLSAEPHEAPVPDLAADELVLRFRSVASPAAFRLAAHLAVGCAHLPVMRLVHAAVEPHPQPQHLAEVVLSGMLTSVPGPAGAYEFRPGVRDVLLGTLPHTAHVRTAGLLSRVNARIEALAGAVPGEFRALVAARGGPVGAVPGDPFALVSRESVRLLRGPSGASGEGRVLAGRYELRERIGARTSREVWRAVEVTTGREVAVTLRSYLNAPELGYPTERFLAESREIARIHHPHLLLNFDAFRDGADLCLVTELVEAPTLSEAMQDHPNGFPADDIARTGRDLLSALEALHEEGIVHGLVRAENILLSPDRGALLCEVPGSAAPRPEDDLLAVGNLLYDMALGTPFNTAWRATDPVEVSAGAVRVGLLPAALNAAIAQLLDESPAVRRRAAAALLATPADARRVYRLLGPPEAWVNGVPSPDGDGPELRMLCALVLARGERVAGTELWEPEWRDDVHAVADRLKRRGHPVESKADQTYRLTLQGADVDFLGVEQLVFQAETADSAGDHALALERYETALGLWAGEPLEGMPGYWAARHRGELAELLRTVVERRDVLRDGPRLTMVVIRVRSRSAGLVPDALLDTVGAVFGVRPQIEDPYGAARLVLRTAAPARAVLDLVVDALPDALRDAMGRGTLDPLRLRVLVQASHRPEEAGFLLGIPPEPVEEGSGYATVEACVPHALFQTLERPAADYERFEKAGVPVWFRRITVVDSRLAMNLKFPLPSAFDSLAFIAEADVTWRSGPEDASQMERVAHWLSDELGPAVRGFGLAQLDLAQACVDEHLGYPATSGSRPKFALRVTLRPSLASLRTLLAPVRRVLVDHDGTLSRDVTRALVDSGRQVIVVTGGTESSVRDVLGAGGNVAGVLVIGRMPHAAATAVRLGVPFVGLADDAASAADLRAAGATLVTTSLGAITDALADA